METIFFRLQNEGKDSQDGSNLQTNKPRARSLPPQMAILDQKRHPKPKQPIGNDIGVARELDTSIRRYPNGFSLDYAPPPRIPDHLETTISVGYTMISANTTTPAKDEESAQVSRELHEIIDGVPTMPSIFQLVKDPEEEDLNRRITQVARQLTETEIRKEYEAKLNPTTAKPDKAGKAFMLPLVSHQPLETAQLQLIAELQQIPHYLVDEGFRPITPSPELIGPLLGGPPLKPEDMEEERSGKSLDSQKYMPLGLSEFIKLMAPKYDFNPNDVVVSIPVGSGFPIAMAGFQPRYN